MSIIHYIRTPKSTEYDFLLELKYGKPNDGEYLDKIPESVIEAAYEELGEKSFMRNPTVEQKKQVLSIYYRQPDYTKRVKKLLHDNLVVYHMLLGTL